jgi:hypothetical protein
MGGLAAEVCGGCCWALVIGFDCAIYWERKILDLYNIGFVCALLSILLGKSEQTKIATLEGIQRSYKCLVLYTIL